MSWAALVTGLLISTAPDAYAQDAAPVITSPETAPELSAPPTGSGDIVVTGSRISRNGYDTPTPVTVISTQELQANSPANLADFVNQLPSVAGSITPANSNRSLASGAAGLNTVNLRGLGSNRTLVLLDGRRSVASATDGTVDINTIPQGLVKSVEIVTGGASAAYGSDAVAGVVNYILDKEYTGIKGDLSYGQTTYGDDDNYRATLTAGTPFAGGRGHLLVSGTYLQREGVRGVPRRWAEKGMYMTQNPAYVPGNGQPQYMPSTQAGLNSVTGGGIVVSGPARGVYFGQGGTINRYDYGDNYNPAGNGEWTIGGDWRESQHIDGTSLQPGERLRSVYGRLSYEISDAVEVFAEASYNRTRGLNWGGRQTDRGNITIRGDNAFIPAALLAQYPSLASTGLTLGSFNADYPTRQSDNTREVQRYLIGAEGHFNLFDTNWKWDGYYQHGVTENRIELTSPNRTKLAYARDAVWNADHTAIVCRVTQTGSTDPLAQGCVPFNSFGIGVNSADAVNYIMGNPWTRTRFQQDVAALNVSTDIDNPWLKPIGLAFGVEHRREETSAYTPEFAQSGWYSGNFPTNEQVAGHYDVTEGYIETLISLPFKLDFNGAARLTSYSQAGEVVTWKAGFTWSPISDLRLRAVRSRDIRAPNLSELFQSGGGNTNSLLNPWTGNSARYRGVPQGNLNLRPEKADTWDVGLVYQPSFLPGFGLSVDYYDIRIKGAIGSLSAQQIVDRCFEGNEDLCRQIALATQSNVAAPTYAYGDGWDRTTGPGAISDLGDIWVYTSNFNYVQERSRGVDVEASYQTPLDRISEGLPGTLSLRALATRNIDRRADNGTQPPTNVVGQNSGALPKWKFRVTANYSIDDLTVQLTGRGFSSGVYSNAYIECDSDCPASTALNRTISDNHLPGAFYVDAYISQKVKIAAANTEFFLQVGNLFNRDPALVGSGPSDTSSPDPGTNRSLYDFLGRTFRLGLRFDLG
ncbi:TonB-dependent receptor [Sphingomonas sp. PL-96]|uniref:TonB-dependent receptor domain-containing protein n=1 Tax=Sphingomonas sp. PL-96 TaxID=2887201 RepID=UPI001E576B17|nr:TonB-dependent receptor [Sphingomonas sp. PL-96]MCC2977060.1 TonB-dependent receptor [Sphingomonas sp. PL-96]